MWKIFHYTMQNIGFLYASSGCRVIGFWAYYLQGSGNLSDMAVWRAVAVMLTPRYAYLSQDWDDGARVVGVMFVGSCRRSRAATPPRDLSRKLAPGGFRRRLVLTGMADAGVAWERVELCGYVVSPQVFSRWPQSNTEQNGGFLSSAQSRHPRKHRTAATTLRMRLGSVPRTPKNNSSKLRVRGSCVLALFHWYSESIVVWFLFGAEELRGYGARCMKGMICARFFFARLTSQRRSGGVYAEEVSPEDLSENGRTA